MKKKVVFITEALYGGGVQRILQIILSHFDYTLYDVTLYTIRKNEIRKDYFPEEINYKYIFDVADNKDPVFRRFWYKIKNKIKLFVYYHFNPSLFFLLFIHEKTDIAIAFIEGYATRLVAGFPKRIKKVAWLHTDIENNHWTDVAFHSKREERKIYGHSLDKIVCVSDIVMQKIKSYAGDSCNACVIYNPIDRNLVLRKSKEHLDYLNINETGATLISLGSLIEVKGYNRLLSVANRLKNEGFLFKLFILGDGIMRNELMFYITNNNLQSTIFLLGYKDNPYPYLNKSDIYVCSSYAEGYNTAITEALVLGKPVVSTECSGVKEQLGEHNEWGICVENSVEGLYQGLKHMFVPEIREHYARQAQIRGKDFTLENRMNEIYQLIEG